MTVLDRTREIPQTPTRAQILAARAIKRRAAEGLGPAPSPELLAEVEEMLRTFDSAETLTDR